MRSISVGPFGATSTAVIALSLILSVASPFSSLVTAQDLTGNSINNNPLKDGLGNCSCYVANSTYTAKNGPSAHGSSLQSDLVTTQSDLSTEHIYFTYHRFFDFRSLATSRSQYTTVPPAVTDDQSTGQETYLSRYQDLFNSQAWSDDWGIQNWGKNATPDFPIRMQNSPANIYISQEPDNSTSDGSIPETYITLRTNRLSTFQSAGEMENRQKNLKYASIRFKFRVRGAAGAVAGLFTFADDVNETDIEILTDDNTTQWRFTNQPSVDKAGNDVVGASLEGEDLPNWNEWQIGRFDWLPNVARFFVGDQLVAENTHSVPRKPCGVVLNMWGDGGVWSGNMTTGKAAYLDISWMQMVFNTSGAVRGVDPEDDSKRRRSVNLSDGAADEEADMDQYGGYFPSAPDSDRSPVWDSIISSPSRLLSALKREPQDGTPSLIQRRRSSKGCQVVCKIDDTPEQGVPVIVSSDASSSSASFVVFLPICITILASIFLV